MHVVSRELRAAQLQSQVQPINTTSISTAPGRTRFTAQNVHRKGANLRAVAVINAAQAVGSSKSGGNLTMNGKAGVGNSDGSMKAGMAMGRTVSASAAGARSSIVKAQRASEEARKALFRA